jgi:hypothetical protein
MKNSYNIHKTHFIYILIYLFSLSYQICLKYLNGYSIELQYVGEKSLLNLLIVILLRSIFLVLLYNG